MNEPVIEMSGVVKTFGDVRALDGLDLRVERGEILGFLGPNGAGKSTAIRVLLGMLRADEGEMQLLGGDPWRDAVELHRRLAYVPGDVSLWPKLTGGETIDLLARLRGGFDVARRDALVERFELDPTRKAGTYSKGNRQKVGLIAALASEVELLVLDEPTSGLDPLMESVFQDCVREAAANGTTVLLSSHILAEVEKLCRRVSIIRTGRTVESGTLADLRHVQQTSITARTRTPVTLDDVAGVTAMRTEGDRVEFEVGDDSLDEVMARLGAAGVVSLQSAPPTLEAIFMRHYSDDGDASDDGVAPAGASK
ncbi:MAG: ABC transporter ATP-binding protein [Actinomycetota bacterium]